MGAVTRVIVVGAGNMGAKWLRTVRDHAGAEPVGLVDLDVPRARGVGDAAGLPDLIVGASLDEVADLAEADAVVDATIPDAHRAVTVSAIRRGLAVLGEKPAAATLAEAVALAALVDAAGATFVVSQSRRFNPQLAAVRDWLAGGAVVGSLSARFSRGPRFGGFREEMASPLLLDMAIHPFDTARWLAASPPVAVYARESNPPWSWYRGAAAAVAVVEFASGADFAYDGTWAGLGADTSWNGDWRITTDRGTVLWDGDHPASVARTDHPTEDLPPKAGAGESLVGSLDDFLSRTGPRGESEIHDNVFSFAIVEAAVQSAAEGRRVDIGELLDRAGAEAVARAGEWDVPEIVPVIHSWGAVADGLADRR